MQVVSSGRRPLLQRSLLAAAALVWASGIAYGFHAIWQYKGTPGATGTVPRVWPMDSRIPRNPDGATLVMVAHPRCPCTRASMSELAGLVGAQQARVKAYVAFFKPSDFPDGWERTDTWRRAEEIPGVTPLADRDGAEAARFGGLTSGQTLLYDHRGRLLFHGGITGARGHVGDNAGRRAVAALLTRGRSDTKSSAVFGCAVAKPTQREVRKP